MQPAAETQAQAVPPKRKPNLSGPIRPPKTSRTDKKVFLLDELWERLSETAKFHTDTYESMGEREVVSRNDWIETELEWAEGQFWKALGGRPTSKSDRAEKLKKYAETLRADQVARETAKK